ncbi:MAG: avidin/streptavidin family protein [Bacteroidota bacterium]
MNRITYLCLVLSCFVAIELDAQDLAQPSDLIGTWHNQKDQEDPSQLVITSYDSTTATISGYFLSPSGTEGGSFPLTGLVNRRSLTAAEQKEEKHQALSVSFSVFWKDYGSITSWTGICFEKAGQLQLNTNWMLVRSVTDYEWDHVLTGYDLFTKREE